MKAHQKFDQQTRIPEAAAHAQRGANGSHGFAAVQSVAVASQLRHVS